MITALAHRREYDEVWNLSPYDVQWFARDAPKENDEVVQPPATPSQPSPIRPRDPVDSWARFMTTVEWKPPNTPQPTEKPSLSLPTNSTAPWAQSRSIRRGVDNPFASKTKPERAAVSYRHSLRNDQDLERSNPRSIPSHHNGNPRLPRPTQLSNAPAVGFRQPFTREPASQIRKFPSTVANHDLPIPLPTRSEWMNASALRYPSTRW